MIPRKLYIFSWWYIHIYTLFVDNYVHTGSNENIIETAKLPNRTQTNVIKINNDNWKKVHPNIEKNTLSKSTIISRLPISLL